MIDLTTPQDDAVPEFDPDDWFGDESPFTSSEDLAAALFSLGGVAPPPMSDRPDDDEAPESESYPTYGSMPQLVQPPLPPTAAPQQAPPRAQQAPPLAQSAPPSLQRPGAPPVPPSTPSAPQGPSPQQAPPAAPPNAQPPTPAPPPRIFEDASEMRKRWAAMTNHAPGSFHVEQQQGPAELPRVLARPNLPDGGTATPAYRVFEPGTPKSALMPITEISIDPDLPPVEWNPRTSLSTLRSTEKVIAQLQLSATHIAWTAAALAFRELNAVSLQHRSKKAFSNIVTKSFSE